jgi:hypothetical protein
MRHVLTLGDRLRGVEAALRSPRTPGHLRPGLEVQRRKLRRELQARGNDRRASGRRRRRRTARAGFLEWLLG